MAATPLTFLERKWQNSSNNNSLIRAATQTNEREQIALLDNDTHRNVTVMGRRTLETIGRFLYWNCSPIRAAIDEIARLATSRFIAQFYGKDREWGKGAEAFLYESDKFLDVRGWPYTRNTYLQNLVRETIVDGDQGTLLTEADGSAKIQVWRSHRIGAKYQTVSTVQGGPYDGATIIDGVIVNEVGRAIAYAIIPDNYGSSMPFAYPSANDFMLNFLPSTSDALRGYSLLGTCAFDMLDRETSKKWLLMLQMISASYAVEIQNESGKADRAKQLLSGPSTVPDSTTGNAQDLPKELVKPGRIMYFQANKGQGIKVVDQNQPGPNVMDFQQEIIRDSLQGMGWSFDFSHNPTKAGGAQMRIVIEKINARLEEIRDMLVEPVCRRIDGFRIAKAIKAGFLPENDEWFKWTYQSRAELTADRKYESEIDLEELSMGVSTRRKVCGKRGDDKDDVADENELDADDRWTRAGRIAGKHGITVQEAYTSMFEKNANGISAAAPALEPQQAAVD
jgi:hypothetical protein